MISVHTPFLFTELFRCVKTLFWQQCIHCGHAELSSMGFSHWPCCFRRLCEHSTDWMYPMNRTMCYGSINGQESPMLWTSIKCPAAVCDIRDLFVPRQRSWCYHFATSFKRMRCKNGVDRSYGGTTWIPFAPTSTPDVPISWNKSRIVVGFALIFM